MGAAMLGQIATVIVILLVGVSAIAFGFVLGMRAKSRPVVDAGIWFTRSVANPLAMKSAGTPGASASVIRHRGRKSGLAYETPVGAVPADDGFVIALPYGERADWPRNVLASGRATIGHEGHSYEVDQPEIVPMRTVENCFSDSDRRSFRLFRVNQCLRVRKSEPGEAASPRSND
jgi:deazaflavin-dependent oxidoreductase (nitroreductase family)